MLRLSKIAIIAALAAFPLFAQETHYNDIFCKIEGDGRYYTTKVDGRKFYGFTRILPMRWMQTARST